MGEHRQAIIGTLNVLKGGVAQLVEAQEQRTASLLHLFPEDTAIIISLDRGARMMADQLLHLLDPSSLTCD